MSLHEDKETWLSYPTISSGIAHFCINVLVATGDAVAETLVEGNANNLDLGMLRVDSSYRR